MLAHSQFENRLGTDGLPRMPLMHCFTGQEPNHGRRIRTHFQPQSSSGKLGRKPATRWFDWPFTPMPRSDNTTCTSGLRLSSTAVSHGFAVARYSSSSFGSHGGQLALRTSVNWIQARQLLHQISLPSHAMEKHAARSTIDPAWIQQTAPRRRVPRGMAARSSESRKARWNTVALQRKWSVRFNQSTFGRIGHCGNCCMPRLGRVAEATAGQGGGTAGPATSCSVPILTTMINAMSWRPLPTCATPSMLLHSV